MSPAWSNGRYSFGTRTTIKPYTYYQPTNEQEYNNIVYNIPSSSQGHPYSSYHYSNSSFFGLGSNKYSETQSSQFSNTITNESSKYDENYHNQQNEIDVQYFYKYGKNFLYDIYKNIFYKNN